MPEHVSNLQSFLTILKTSGKKLVVVDFHATWCGPCHAIAPFYEQLATRYAGRARFLKVDVDAAEDVARHCSISAMPTFHLYLQGRLVSEFSGADQRRLSTEVERYAPSSAEVAFAGQGQRLGAGGASASGAPTASGPPTVDWNMRAVAAEAAAKRFEAAKKTTAESKLTEDAKDDKRDEEESAKPGASQEAATITPSDTLPQNDSRLNVNQVLLSTLVDEMGFPKVRAEKALILTGNKGVEQAVEWCFQHADDVDIDEPLQVVTSEGELKPKLSPEEAKKKAEDLYARARAKREVEDKKEAVEREKNRVRSGKEIATAKREYEEQARKRAVEEKKREKLEAMKERQRVREMLEADKQRRREKFNMPGANPSSSTASRAEAPVPKSAPTPSVSAGKIQFRMPDGGRIEGEFGPEQKVGDLVKFLSAVRPELRSQNITLSQQYPRRKLTESDYGVSLTELNLLPRGALTVSFL